MCSRKLSETGRQAWKESHSLSLLQHQCCTLGTIQLNLAQKVAVGIVKPYLADVATFLVLDFHKVSYSVSAVMLSSLCTTGRICAPPSAFDGNAIKHDEKQEIVNLLRTVFRLDKNIYNHNMYNHTLSYSEEEARGEASRRRQKRSQVSWAIFSCRSHILGSRLP